MVLNLNSFCIQTHRKFDILFKNRLAYFQRGAEILSKYSKINEDIQRKSKKVKACT